MSDLQFLMDKIDESDKPAPDITSDQDSLIKKAFLEGRMRQICQYIKNKRSHVDFLGDYAALRVEDHKHLDRLCKDYLLYSPNLDGSIQEILERVEDMTEKNDVFLTQLAKREKAEVQMMNAQVKEVFEQWVPLIRKKLEEIGHNSGPEKSKVYDEDTKDKS